MPASAKKRVHPWPVRLCHWLNVLVMVGMVMSGWGIYNASPLFSFTFPAFLTLGGWLGGNIAWHLAVMWLLFVNAAIYVLWGLFSGHFRRRFFPFTPASVLRDIGQALHFKLPHQGPLQCGAKAAVCGRADVGCAAGAVRVIDLETGAVQPAGRPVRWL